MREPYHLCFHPLKYNTQHLRERGFGSRLNNQTLAEQVDVEASANGFQKGALMNFAMWRRDGR